jgi:hypothetical protein
MVPVLNDKVYNILKYVALVLLPAVASLYFAISEVWELPHGPEVMATITTIDTFLGVVLGISTGRYNQKELAYDGAILVEEDDERKLFSLELSSEPDQLDQKDEVRLKVKPQ